MCKLNYLERFRVLHANYLPILLGPRVWLLTYLIEIMCLYNCSYIWSIRRIYSLGSVFPKLSICIYENFLGLRLGHIKFHLLKHSWTAESEKQCQDLTSLDFFIYSSSIKPSSFEISKTFFNRVFLYQQIYAETINCSYYPL